MPSIEVEVRTPETCAGLFSSERLVSFTVGERRYESIVDEYDVTGTRLRVSVVAEEPGTDRLLVQLPRETITGGQRMYLPKLMVLN